MITALVTTPFVICIRDTYVKIRFATKFAKLSDFTREGLYDLYEKKKLLWTHKTRISFLVT